MRLVLTLAQRAEVQLQRQLRPGRLQRRAQEGHQRCRQGVVLAAEQGGGPGDALAGVGRAQLLDGRLDRGVGRRLVGLEPGVEDRQPATFTHQGVGRQRRHAVGQALTGAMGIRGR